MWRALSASAVARRAWHASRLSTRSYSTEAPMFTKVLIANRGEIACRVMNTAKRMGVRTVAVFSDADRDARHVAMADEAFHIGAPPPGESYLVYERIIDVAKRSGAQAIHPGYGFLSENEAFANACADAGIEFIGPPASAIRAMGSKSESKKIMEAAAVPCVPGYHGDEQAPDKLRAEAERIGYPVMLKAVMGGGGKGMRIVRDASEFDAALEAAKRESSKSFGDERMLVEKYLENPRHIEFQVFADKQGNTVHLFERDCSVQRRHQKVVEEAPAPGMSKEQRMRMGEAAVNAARAVNYVGAGTVEFIVDNDAFYFMEMNTRLQVEHPVTEMVTGVDLVDWQLQVAAGRTLPATQDELHHHGHSFEARIYAENPENDFLPGAGTLTHLRTPEPTEHVRVETGVREGDDVSIYYDPMIAKLVVSGPNRQDALNKLHTCLEEYEVAGLPTNIPFLKRVIRHDAFVVGQVTTNFIAENEAALLEPLAPSRDHHALTAVAQLLYEAEATEWEAAHTHDSTSPWNVPDGKRLNTQYTRTLDFDDAESMDVTYYGLGDYGVQVGGDEVRVQAEPCGERAFTAVVDGRRVDASYQLRDGKLSVFADGALHEVALPSPVFAASGADAGSLLSPMPGKIVKVLHEANAQVKEGDPIVIMEAMKMEHVLRAPCDGVVEKVNYGVGEFVEDKKLLVQLKGDE